MFSLAKTQMAGMVVQHCFAHWSFLLPVQRLRETPYVLAFSHPRPAYPQHVVIVPKKQIPSLLALSQYPDYAIAIFNAAQNIVATLGWSQGTYVLCANGGSRQEVQQVHFHLFAGVSPVDVSLGEMDRERVHQNEQIKVIRSPRPDGQLQFKLLPLGSIQTNEDVPLGQSIFAAFVGSLPSLNQQFHLIQQGYTFLMDDVHADHPTSVAGYILAGDKSARNTL